MIGQQPVGRQGREEVDGHAARRVRLVGPQAFYSTNATAAGNIDHFHR